MNSNEHQWDSLIRNVNLATFDPNVSAENREYGTITAAALAVTAGHIAWVGKEADLPTDVCVAEVIDGRGEWLLPGFIDCHTHIVFGGNRAHEFEQRLQGVSYEEIARAGGGIANTVNATRQADVASLVAKAMPRLQALLDEGVTGIEIKSGYGLNLDTERNMLLAATELAKLSGIKVQRTFLGAHALPPEFTDNAEGYIDYLCDTMLPTLAAEGLIDAVDGFCESIAFSAEQMAQVFATAKGLGLPVKLHAEQLSNQCGAELVASYHGLSADHLEHLDESGIAAMKAADTTAVLLPGAFYFLRETKLPPITQLQRAGVDIALGSDANPGSSPLFSLRLTINFACTLWGMTPAQSLTGVTRNAAKALGWEKQCGMLALGKRADLVLWPIESPAELAYQIGGIKPTKIWLKGQPSKEQ